MNWLRASTVVAAATLISRVLGLVRDILLAQTLGAGTAADAVLIALKIPNLTRRLFAEGAFAAAFVPLLSKTKSEDGPAAAIAFASRALTLLAILLLIMTALAMIAMPLVIRALAPGFDLLDPRRDLAIMLARRTFPYAFFISLTALLAGVLNVSGRFAVAASAPVVLNLVMIAVLLSVNVSPIATAAALALSVPLAGALQLALVWWACWRAGIIVIPRLDLADRRLMQLGKRLLPGIAGTGVYQLNVMVATVLATSLAPGAVSFLYFSDRLAQLPLGIIGLAISTAILPLMALRLSEGKYVEAYDLRDKAIELSLLLTLPAAAGLTVLALPIVQVLFERGLFDTRSAEATASALQAFALGLPAAVMVRVVAAGLFAHGDTRSPLIGASVALFANVAVGLAALPVFGHLGLAIAASAASWANLATLAFRMMRLEGRAFSNRTKLRAAGATVSAVLAASFAHQVFVEFQHLGAMAAVSAAVVLGTITFFALAIVVRAASIQELLILYRDRA